MAQQHGRVSGKVAIVTGATIGIGRAAAVLLAREGAKVIATGRRAEEGRETERRIRANGGDGVFLHQDVADEARWIEIVGEAKRRFGGLHILVNNAGAFDLKPVADTTLADFDRIYRTNVEGTWLGMKHAMALMRASGGGSIVNVSSLMGQVGVVNGTAYCASKGAITAMTKAAAAEGGSAVAPVRVNSLHPGIVWTEMIDTVVGTSQDIKDAMAQDTPLRFHGTPEDLANAILYLASEESAFVTGAELNVDGGRGAD